MKRYERSCRKPASGAAETRFSVGSKRDVGKDLKESLSLRHIVYLLWNLPFTTADSLHLAGKPRFFEQSENHLPRDRPACVPQFSERNSGSSFFE
jgi:hypothetical protein